MKKISFYLGIWAFILVSVLLASDLDADDSEILKSGFSLCLITDKAIYSPGDVIEMTLEISNQTNEEITLRFKDAQRFDFMIEKDGVKLWRWSDGRMFAQLLGEERLSPGKTITYTVRFEGKLNVGVFRVTGMVVDRNIPLTMSSVVIVK